MIRRPPRSTQSRSSAASDVYKRQSLKVRHHFGRDLGIVLDLAHELRHRGLVREEVADAADGLRVSRDGDKLYVIKLETPRLLRERQKLAPRVIHLAVLCDYIYHLLGLPHVAHLIGLLNERLEECVLALYPVEITAR